MQHNSKDSGSPYPALTICVIKKDSFKPNLENTEGFFLSSPNWKFVPQQKGLKAEGSACHSTFKYSRNHNKACSLRVKRFNRVIQYYKIIIIRWGPIILVCITIIILVCKEEDFKSDPGFNRKPVKRNKYRRNVLFF